VPWRLAPKRRARDQRQPHRAHCGVERALAELGIAVTLGHFEGRHGRIRGGNLRLVQRLFSQVNRLVEINELTSVTRDVVDTAREALIIGPR